MTTSRPCASSGPPPERALVRPAPSRRFHLATDIGDLCSIEWEDPIDAIERCYELGWTDGLPVVPPTQERVQQFLDYVGRSAEEVIGSVRERRRQVPAGPQHVDHAFDFQATRTWCSRSQGSAGTPPGGSGTRSTWGSGLRWLSGGHRR